MQPYTKAIAWTFWRERRSYFALFLIMAMAYSLFIRQFSPMIEKYEATQISIIFALFIELFSISMLMISGLNSQVIPLNINDHLYTKPVPSHKQVLIYLGLAFLSIFSIHLISVLLFRFVALIDWPFIMPLINLFTITLCVFAILWSLIELPFLCLSAITIVCAFFSASHMDLTFKHPVSLLYFLLHTFPYLLIIDIFAIVICFKAVKNARCGERLRSTNFWERIYLRLKTLIPGKNWKLNSPQKAYFWFLCRGAIVMPLLNIVFVLIIFLIYLLTPSREKGQEVIGSILALASADLFILPFFVALMSHQDEKTFGLSYRPISERSILVNLLKAFLVNYIISLIIFAIGTTLIILLLSARGHFEIPNGTLNEIKHFTSLFSFSKIVIYLLVIWTAVGLVSSISITGRKWPIIAFFSSLLLFAITTIFVNSFFSLATIATIKYSFICLVVLGSIIGTIIAMIYAVRRHLITSSFVLYLFGIYVLFCIIGLLINYSYTKSPDYPLLLCGMLTLPFAPFATAPLALYWNRHR